MTDPLGTRLATQTRTGITNEDFGTGLLRSLSATIGDPLLRPTGLVIGSVGDMRAGGVLLSREEANEQYGIDDHLQFASPINEELAKRRRERTLDSLRRDDIIRRSPQGIIPGAARFGAAIAGSVVDPINIASAFIPVAGEARAAAILARVGFTRAATSVAARRVTSGVIEGFVGGVAVEALTYPLAQHQQIDYTAFDALTNVAIGSILGAALHPGLGAMSDFMRRRSPEVQRATLQKALDDFMDGGRVDVEPVLRLDPAVSREGLRGSTALTSPSFVRSLDQNGFDGLIGHITRGQDIISADGVVREGSGLQAIDKDIVAIEQAGRTFKSREAALKKALEETRRTGNEFTVLPKNGRFAVAQSADVEIHRSRGEAMKFKTRAAASKEVKSSSLKGFEIAELSDGNFVLTKGASDEVKASMKQSKDNIIVNGKPLDVQIAPLKSVEPLNNKQMQAKNTKRFSPENDPYFQAVRPPRFNPEDLKTPKESLSEISALHDDAIEALREKHGDDAVKGIPDEAELRAHYEDYAEGLEAAMICELK